jgi:general secretion pathway protein A
MYQSHWGLQESPFRSCLDLQFFHQSPTHEEALARLRFLVEARRRLGLLLGTPGSGKSLLLEVFSEHLRRKGLPVAKVNLLGITPAELLQMLAEELHAPPCESDSMAALWQSVTDSLAEYRYQQLDTVVLLDDAHRASRDVLQLVTRLAKHDPSRESRLVIVMAGTPKRMGRLGRSLLELAELRIDVEPWQQRDTAEFLTASLARAGRQAPVFGEPAVARLHELSRGIPRRITQLADLSLVAGAGEQLAEIDADVVESVYHELGVVRV